LLAKGQSRTNGNEYQILPYKLRERTLYPGIPVPEGIQSRYRLGKQRDQGRERRNQDPELLKSSKQGMTNSEGSIADTWKAPVGASNLYQEGNQVPTVGSEGM